MHILAVACNVKNNLLGCKHALTESNPPSQIFLVVDNEIGLHLMTNIN